MTLSAEIKVALSALQRGDNSFGGDRFAPRIEALLPFTDGTGANQANLLYAGERTVADGADDDVDLSGALADAFGATITAAEVAALLLINAPISGNPNTTALTIGGADSPFEGFLGGTDPTLGPIPPGGVVLLAGPSAAGLGAITADTADELRVSNASGAANTYQLAILARSA